MNEIRIFESPEFGQVRTAGTSEEPLFCAADVCKCLGYTNNRKAIADHCDAPDVTKYDIGVVTGKKANGEDAVQTVHATFVTENGLLCLIFGSHQPQAKKFRKWMTSEVIPSLKQANTQAVTSNNGIRVFENAEFGKIRTAGTPEEPLFCAIDVCNALGYTNNSKAISDHCEEDDITKRYTIDEIGRSVSMSFITESGLYSLIFGSKLEGAKRFKRWVTSEVLPSIRKHGAYMTDETILHAITEPEFLIQLTNALKEEKEKRLSAERICKDQNKQIEYLAKRNDYLGTILASPSTLTVTQIAQDYGMSATALNKILCDLKVQYRVDKQWILYAEYKGKNYVASETYCYTDDYDSRCTNLCTRWTQKGRMFLYYILKKNGILPVIERLWNDNTLKSNI